MCICSWDGLGVLWVFSKKLYKHYSSLILSSSQQGLGFLLPFLGRDTNTPKRNKEIQVNCLKLLKTLLRKAARENNASKSKFTYIHTCSSGKGEKEAALKCLVLGMSIHCSKICMLLIKHIGRLFPKRCHGEYKIL